MPESLLRSFKSFAKLLQIDRLRWEYLAAAAAFACLVLITLIQFGPAGRPGSPVRYVNIPASPQLHQVSMLLKSKHLVRNSLAFDLLGRMSGAEGRIKPGSYALSPGLSAGELLRWLMEGRGRMLRFTVPEGYSAQRIAQLLEARNVGEGPKFLRLVAAPASFKTKHPWLEELGRLPSLEGYLFPDTYLFEGNRVDEFQLVDDMLTRFKATVLKAYVQEAQPIAGLHEALTMASIIELEAVRPEERALISGVFYKRLNLGMKLGSDPTVEYALRRHQSVRGLSFKDVKIDSPYNTYRYAGLPPAPIGNPGLPSFIAALHPEDTPYLFFVAKGAGRHAFTRTYAEHLAAQRRFRP